MYIPIVLKLLLDRYEYHLKHIHNNFQSHYHQDQSGHFPNG
jgi:hypothetical protein